MWEIGAPLLLLALAVTLPAGASFGERESTVDNLKPFDESTAEQVAEEVEEFYDDSSLDFEHYDHK